MSKIDRDAAARYGLNIADVQSVVSLGDRRRERRRDGRGPGSAFPINVRYPREMRDSLEQLARACRSLTERGAQIPLGDVAQLVDRRRAADAQERERAACRAGSMSTSRGRDLRSAVRGHAAMVANRMSSCRRAIESRWSGPVRIPASAPPRG